MFNETCTANTTTVSSQSNLSNLSNQGRRRGGNGNIIGNNRDNRQKMSTDDIRAYNLQTKCTHCGKHGHWVLIMETMIQLKPIFIQLHLIMVLITISI